MIIRPAHRTESVKEYYFSVKRKEMDRLNVERVSCGEDKIINLGIGAPDGMPPAEAIKTLNECAQLPDSHAYQSYNGSQALREAFAKWYKDYYGVILNPDDEIQPLVGSKEGILLTSLAFIDKGDKVLVPDPGYPTYTSASRLVEAQILTYDLKADNNWWPDFDAIEKMDLEGVKIMWTNYPNMPTGAKATPELYQRLADFGNRHHILIVNDNPYSFILTKVHLSILAAKGAKDCCLELNSLSKAHNMSGWRIGMIGGSADMIAEMLKVKSQMDSGMFKPLQMAAVAALGQKPQWYDQLNAEYERRKVEAGKIFDTIGASYDHDSSGLFLWGRISKDNHLLEGTDPSDCLGKRISDKILYNAGVFITPGFIFGHNGEDYIRISLCAKPAVLARANEKISEL